MKEKRNRKIEFKKKKTSNSPEKRKTRQINKKDFKTEEKKPKKYISQKRRKARMRIFLIFSLIVVLGTTLTILSITVFFPIKNINIVNNKRYSDKQISSAIGVV